MPAAVEVMRRKGVEMMSGGGEEARAREQEVQQDEAGRERCDPTGCAHVTNANEKLMRNFIKSTPTQHCHIRWVKYNCWLSFT